MKYYKFKNVKHSVIMELEYIDEYGIYHLRNREYPCICYEASQNELEEI